MKSTSITIASVQVDPKLESEIRKKDAALKELAAKNAEHFAARKQPAITGDTLDPYVGELKAGYEQLATEIFQHLQPSANIPEAKIEADFLKEKDSQLETEIKGLEHLNQIDEYSIGKNHHGIISSRFQLGILLTLVITMGDTLFNTKSFQVTGESLLFALILSISLSVGVLIFSHMVASLYRAAKSNLKKWLIVVGALLVATIIFSALAVFRSSYLASHDIYIKPVYFVAINLFFFIVSTLLSYSILPTWQEIKQSAHHLKVAQQVRKRIKRIELLKKERETIRHTIAEKSKERIRILHCASYSGERFRKMYQEAIAIFKRTNLAYRPDHSTPDCYSHSVPDLDINEIPFTFTSNRKLP